MGEYVGHLYIDGESIPVFLERGEFVKHTDRYLTAAEAGEYIGANRQRIADLTYAGKIKPDGYDGRKPLYRRETLDAYLGNG